MTAFAIDFGSAIGDNSFQGIAKKGIPGVPLTRLRPPGMAGEPAAAALTAEAYVDHYEKSIAGSDTAPSALLGYCAGGLFALELAARLRARGLRTGPVVLLDTIGTGPRNVADEFARSLRALGWSEETTFGMDVPRSREEALPILVEDLAEGVAFLEQVMSQFVSVFVASHGVGEDMVATLTQTTLTRLSSCLRYVAASTVRADPRPDGSTHIIVSRSLTAAAEEFWCSSGARVHVVDCEHRELLDFEGTYRHLLECLESKDLFDSGG